MTAEERATLIWNASSQSKQNKNSFIAFVAEHINAETEELCAEVERLRTERNQDAITGQAALDESNNEVIRLRIEVTRLRAALEAVEWDSDDNYPDIPAGCPWCGSYQRDGHSSNCQRQAALNEAQP